jgi:hypothetical protein
MNDPNQFLGKPDEYLEWAKDNFKFSPSFCARHWMPCPVDGKNGMLVSIILMIESFGLMPDDIGKQGDLTGSINSWMANQIIPLCCKFGDEKMSWLWWIIDKENYLCRQPYPQTDVSVRVCWRLAAHSGEHEWERPHPRSVFDLMDEVKP